MVLWRWYCESNGQYMVYFIKVDLFRILPFIINLGLISAIIRVLFM